MMFCSATRITIFSTGSLGTTQLYGGDGNDQLNGGSDAIPAGFTDDDSLFGGAGNDIYQFSAVNGGHDTIFDFQFDLVLAM